ncbi:MAG TPA: hypothetical protein VFP61_08720 [Acidimicrobiales bacterium]|nr:hypothetical protein [Acidimicrobiales bacterium]
MSGTDDETTAAIGERAELPAGVADLLASYLARQRWYAGSGEPPAVEVVASRVLPAGGEGTALWWVVVDAAGGRYQLLLGARTGAAVPEGLAGNERVLLGAAGDCTWYDATADTELALPLLAIVSGGSETAAHVRPITAEQSNTSLVYDDRVILKLFRKLMAGPNPDVEVTTALAAGGFQHVAAPVASWREQGVDYAFAQRFLAGGSEGWALALTSLRDFYAGDPDDPAEAGGDFAGEARRLGQVTAEMHRVLADTYGVGPLPADRWDGLVGDIGRRLDALGDDRPAAAGAAVDRFRSLRQPVPAIRVHGDYHLGQVMRTDTGWYVLDFEGEPARALDQRVQTASPLKDVTGMLRSLAYAARVALRERAGGGEGATADLEARAEAWEQHNRQAFLAGYEGADVADLLPPGGAAGLVADAYELDKALYELDYERAYRPDWVDIPMAAVVRLGAVGADRIG